MLEEEYWEKPEGVPDTVNVSIAGTTECDCAMDGFGYGPDYKVAGYGTDGDYELDLYEPKTSPENGESGVVRWEKVVPASGGTIHYYTTGSPPVVERDGTCSGTAVDALARSGGTPSKKIQYRDTGGSELVYAVAGYTYDPGPPYEPTFYGGWQLFQASRSCFKGGDVPYKDAAVEDVYCGYTYGAGGLAAWGGYCYVDLGDDAP